MNGQRQHHIDPQTPRVLSTWTPTRKGGRGGERDPLERGQLETSSPDFLLAGTIEIICPL